MPTDTRESLRARALAPAHECAWCRSLAVVALVVMDLDTRDGSAARSTATARCESCGRVGPLVPAGRAC